MARALLAESQIHTAIREVVQSHGQQIVGEVEAAVAAHPVVVVGMRQNPVVKKARRLLESAGASVHYLEYGNYFSGWRRRNALKMWTGWPTFPMVFVGGTLLGGASDLEKLLLSGELQRLLEASTAPARHAGA